MLCQFAYMLGLFWDRLARAWSRPGLGACLFLCPPGVRAGGASAAQVLTGYCCFSIISDPKPVRWWACQFLCPPGVSAGGRKRAIWWMSHLVQTSSISLDLTWHIGPTYSLASTHMRAKHAHAGKLRSTVRLAVALQCYIHDIYSHCVVYSLLLSLLALEAGL